MAHVVIAEDYDAVRRLLMIALEGEGHQVTAPEGFWGVLATLRSVLHPVIVIYSRDRWWTGSMAPHEEGLAALEASYADLQRHRYIAMNWKPRALAPRLAAIEDGLQIEELRQPFNLLVLVDTVLRIAEQLPT
jgi:hypothetical protein